MSNRNVDELMEELYSVVERAWHLPLSGGKAMVDGSEVKQLLDELRDNLPQETRQARAIVADRNQIIADAKREAEGIVRAAEDRAKRMVQQDAITKQAREQAESMLNQASSKSRELRKATNEYVDDLLRRADDALAEGLTELRKTRQGIKATQHNGK
ncbi:MAG: ATPase [Oscillospiraceae bacterium]|nr:ATPase [Oscillospiraceae bacterium]